MAADCCGSAGTRRESTAAGCDVAPAPTSPACPECDHRGRALGRVTLEALLTSAALRRLGRGQYHFCSDPGCDIVYYDGGTVFRKSDLSVPVWQKSSDPVTPVCYCFGYSEHSIRGELAENGESRIKDEITRLIQGGKCACEVRNPQGTCCLGNVAALLQRIHSEQEH